MGAFKLFQIYSKLVLATLLSASLSQAGNFQNYVGPVPTAFKELAFFLKQTKQPDQSHYRPLPRGILLTGQTGCGKTFLVNALADEAKATPFIFSDSTDFIGSEENIEELSNVFTDAKKKATASESGYCVLVLENFDVFSIQISMGMGADKVERRPEVLALCEEMDQSDNVITIGISHTKNYDPLLLRSCRFGVIAEFTLPTQPDRLALMSHFAALDNVQFESSINLELVALVLYGFTPADLKQLVENAAIAAGISGTNIITKEQLHEAIFAIFRSKGFLDKEFLARLQAAINVLSKNVLQKQGFERIIGTIPTEIKNLVEQLRDNQSFQRFGLVLPKGILFVGPPGTGKTTLARAIAEEVGSAFIPISGSEFADKYVGGGAQIIRNLFEEARLKAKDSPNQKTIIFIDELDSIGKRTGYLTDSTITELLTQMDGFSEDDPIIVIAASNHPNNLDPALLRPGRFDKIVKIGLPDTATRILLLKNYLKAIPVNPDININLLANATSNFSPAELKELIQKAATLAKDENASQLEQTHFIAALKKSLREKILKGDKQAQQQIDAVDVLFFGKTAQKGFARIAGGVPTEINDLVGMITNPARYAKFGLSCPHGILFAGPPGTGKTLLAKAIAEEIGCEFIEAKGSEFVEKYVGVGAQRVRDLFQEARDRAAQNIFGKTIIFIDELDAIGSRTSAVNDTEASRTITELLTQMDGFSKDDSVIVIAATNRPSALDAALLRAGRFDTIVEIGLPDASKRRSLFQMYCKAPISPEVSFDCLADLTAGFSAADIKEVVNKAALQAMHGQQEFISQTNFEDAIQLIIYGKQGQRTAFI